MSTSSITLTAKSPGLTRRLPAQEVLDAFFEHLSPTTQASYRESLLFFARWLSRVGELGVLDVEPATAMVQFTGAFFQWDAARAHSIVLRYLGALKQLKLAPNTINVRLSAIRSLAKLGRQLGLSSFLLEVRGVRAENVRDTRGPTLEVVRGLLARVDREAGLEQRAFIRLIFECGLRGVELRELQVADLKLDSAKPHVLIRGKGKTGKRPLTVSEKTGAVLRRWLVVRERVGGAEARDGESYVFSPRGKPLVMLSKQALHARVSKLGKRFGIKLWPHGLRHSAITALLDATDGNVREVQKFSRHARLETLMKYDDERRDVAGELSKKLSSLTEE